MNSDSLSLPSILKHQINSFIADQPPLVKIKAGFNPIKNTIIDRAGFLLKSNENRQDYLNIAAEYGHFDLVKLFLHKYSSKLRGKFDLNVAAAFAAFLNNKEIFYYLVEQGANDFTMAAGFASHHGHMDIIKFCMEQKGTDYRLAVGIAMNADNEELVQYYVDAGFNDWKIVLASISSIKWAKICLEKGGVIDEHILIGAIRGGNMDMFNFLLSNTKLVYHRYLFLKAIQVDRETKDRLEFIKVLLDKYRGSLSPRLINSVESHIKRREEYAEFVQKMDKEEADDDKEFRVKNRVTKLK